MKTIALECPVCRTPYQVPEELAGRTTKCTTCGTGLEIPKPVIEAKLSGNLTAVDWLVAILFPPIGLIIGILRLIRGKPSAGIMIAASIIGIFIIQFLRVLTAR